MPPSGYNVSLTLNFHSFDGEYVRRLTEGDPLVSDHFSAYFGELLSLKLRVRVRSPQLAEDIKQETLLRVLQTLRQKGGVEHPERFGAFVNAVSNNVLLEMLRGARRHDQIDEDAEPQDRSVDLDAALVTRERKTQVHAILAELPEKDRELLRMVFLEEQDRTEVCRRFQVDGEYLRVLLHRAKWRFRNLYSKRLSSTQ
jgi:RNA polymerase sigma-70 factor (ECF subfamily)